MDVQNNNITIQIHAKNLQGKRLRVADCDLFIVHVYTDDPSFYLSFSGRDMLATERVDEITIPKRQMEQLRSGVVQYTYHYLPKTETNLPIEDDGECTHERFHRHRRPHIPTDFIDDELINSKPIVTSIYWRNLMLKPNNYPANGANMNDIQRLHRMIDIEVNNRIKDVEALNKRFDGEFTEKLDEEIARSIAEDERLNELIEALQSKTDEVIDNADKNTEDVDNKIEETAKGIEEEEARAKKAEADIEVKIKQEEIARIGADEILDAKLTMEKERATANEQNLADRISSVSEKFESFKTIQSDSLASEITRAKETEKGLNSLVQNVTDNLNAEISRAAQKDIEHQILVDTEANRAQAVENKIATDLETEVSRAKDAEKHILDEVHGLTDTVSNLATATNVYTKSEVDNKVNQVKNDIDTINNWVNNHNNDVDSLNTKVNSISKDVDKAKADILAEVAKCDAENDKQATVLKTLSDSVYTKSEIDTKVSHINSAISVIENWKNNHSDNTDELNAKVAKLIADDEKLQLDLSKEATDRFNADTVLQTKADAIEGKVDAEIERAKTTEKLIGDGLAELKANVSSKDTELTDAIAEVDSKLTIEVARAKASEKVNSDTIAVINGDVETNGSIKKSLADAKGYTDAEIAKLSLAKDTSLVDTLKSYATNADVDKKISDVIGTAPDALDTLGKISTALNNDSDAISAINSVLVGKANSADVYIKSEIDTKVSTINNAITKEQTDRATADTTINGRIDDLISKVNANETANNTSFSTVETVLNAEVTRAKAEEKKISDKVDSEIAKVDTKYNELNAKVIQDIADSTAKDTELEALISAIDTKLTNTDKKVDNEVKRATDKDNELVAKDTELEARIQANTDNIVSEIVRSKQVEKELNDKINSINLDSTNANLSTEVDRATAAEAAIQSALDAEIVRAKAVEGTLTTSINNEIARAKAEEKKLSDKIDSIDIPTVDFTEVNNSISTLETKVDNEIARAKNAEKINADNITSLQTSVGGLNDSIASANATITQLQADSSAKDSEIESNLNTEKKRAENAENALSDKIDIINGDKETVGSIAHAIHDAEHYTDDKIAEHKFEADEKYQPKGDYYTKSEVDKAIADVDVTEQLKDYVKAEDNTVIKNNKGNVVKSLILDLSNDGDNVISVYDSNEVDAKFATKKELQEAIDAIELGSKDEIDLSDYYNKNEVDNKIDSIDIPTVDLSDYYTKSEVDDKIDAKIDSIEIPTVDLSDYVTKQELNTFGGEMVTVNDKIALIQTNLSDKVNSTDVYVKSEIDLVVDTVNNKLDSKLSIDSFNEWSDSVATKEYVDTKVASIEIPSLDAIESDISSINLALTDKADKSEIPSVEGLASEQYVDEKIGEIHIPDVSSFVNSNDVYSKIQIDSLFATKSEIPSIKGLASEVYVNNVISEIEIPSVEGLASETYVNDKINNLIHTYTAEEYENLTDEEKNNSIVIIL